MRSVLISQFDHEAMIHADCPAVEIFSGFYCYEVDFINGTIFYQIHMRTRSRRDLTRIPWLSEGSLYSI
jgi:hypothetical protein